MSETLLATARIGVGIDTARYGHYATFMDEDRQTAARGFTFPESREGYEQFQAALERLAERHGGNVHFHIRLDAAGQYAVNLEMFLRQLPFPMTISVGEPKRNKDYKNAHFPKRKADPVDSLACARFAVVERPPATDPTPAEFIPLRDVAGALQSQSRQTTRRTNQLHAELARVFPELAALAPNISAEWVLKLLDKYPTPARIAAAHTDSLVNISHVTRERALALQTTARRSTGSLRGLLAEQLVRHLVGDVGQSRRAEEALEQAFDALPAGGHQQLLTIPGIGPRTAAALVAKIVSIDRFQSPESLVNYFGFFPEQNTSGVDKQGNPLPTRSPHMSPKGNDLVRGLLWMATQSALRCNAPVKALYARQRARGKRGDVALGHCARKMLHLVFALWKSNQPFDRERFAEPAAEEPQTAEPQTAEPQTAEPQTPSPAPPVPAPAPAAPPAQKEAAAGRKEQGSDRIAVTADSTHLGTRSVSRPAGGDKQSSLPATEPGAPSPCYSQRIDFADLRRQVSMADVLRRLDLLRRLRGNGPQRRGPCPVHEKSSETGRSFSVNLVKQVFRCLDPECQAHGNPLDLWAAVHHLPLHAAALDLAKTFHLKVSRIDEPEPQGSLP
jgi:transposase